MKRLALGLTAALVMAFGVRADGALDGNWKLTTINAASESTAAIIKVGIPKGGKPDAAVVFSPANVDTRLSDFKVTDSTISFTLHQTQKRQNRSFTTEMEFIGVIGKDSKLILGSSGANGIGDRFRSRAKLEATDKTEMAASELTQRQELPEPMKKAQELNASMFTLQNQMMRERDADKKKELQEKFAEASKKAREESAGLYREVIQKHAESPAALDAAMNLIRQAGQSQMSADEAKNITALIQKHSEAYGPAFQSVELMQVSAALLAAKGLDESALAAAATSANALNEALPASIQDRVLNNYKMALEKNGKTGEAKALEPRLAKLDKILDTEYLAKVPPFKPEAYLGRKEKSANQTVVMELFTGAQCPPCVAADVAFDALGTAYPHHDLILIQYHMHIPGPDPMVNPDTIARWDYYREKFPKDITGTPSTIFNGKAINLRGGGPMGVSESKFNEYREVIDPLLEMKSPVVVTGKANRSGEKISIDVDVKRESASDKLKLRLLVVEDVVKFVGGNSLRFHHHVVRGMPGGAGGVDLTGTEFHHAATADVAEVRSGLDKYLTSFAEKRPFPQPGRPMEMKNLKVIALVQNDETREIVQAAEFEIEGQASGGTGGR
jgi:hypothetical protein